MVVVTIKMNYITITTWTFARVRLYIAWVNGCNVDRGSDINGYVTVDEI